MIEHSEIQTLKNLSNFLRCSENLLISYLTNEVDIIDLKPNFSNEDFEKLNYSERLHSDNICLMKFYIRKKNFLLGYRIVYTSASYFFSNMLKLLNSHFNDLYLPENCVHGFVSKRNIKTNASQHLAKKYLLSIDIKDFFETITSQMIQVELENLKFTKEVSEWISKLLTLNNKLVQGYNTSPTIANIVASSMDKDFLALCKNDIIYTRYADDLYFSSNIELPKLEDLETIIIKHGFQLNPTKTKYMPRGSKQYVTGLSVFDQNCPRIPKRIKRNLRLELFYINKWGLQSHVLKNLGYTNEEFERSFDIQYEVSEMRQKTIFRINGWIQFIKSIELNLGIKLNKQFKY